MCIYICVSPPERYIHLFPTKNQQMLLAGTLNLLCPADSDWHHRPWVILSHCRDSTDYVRLLRLRVVSLFFAYLASQILGVDEIAGLAQCEVHGW